MLCAAAQPLNQLSTKRPIQALSCPLLGAPALVVLTESDCAGAGIPPLGFGSGKWARRGAGSWGGGAGGTLAGQGREGEEGRGAGAELRAVPGWAKPARTHFCPSYGLGYEIAQGAVEFEESAFLSAMSCRREKKREMRIFGFALLL